MRHHNLKIEEKFLSSLLYGEKTFELRYNDRNYQKGDVLIFKMYSHSKTVEFEFEILSVFSGTPNFGLAHGWVILSIKRINE